MKSLLAKGGLCGHDGHARTVSYPPYIWAENEGCRSAHAFEVDLKHPNKSGILTGPPARAFDGFEALGH